MRQTAGVRRTQNIPIATQGRRKPSAKRRSRNARQARNGRKRRNRTTTAAQNIPRARKRPCRSYDRPNATFRRPTIHSHIITANVSPRQRGQTPYAEAALRPRPASPFLRRSRRRTKPALPEKIGEGGLIFMRAYFFSASQSMVSSLLLRERNATMRSGSSVWRDISARSST